MRYKFLLSCVMVSLLSKAIFAFADPTSASVATPITATSCNASCKSKLVTADVALLQREIEQLKRQIKQLQPDITQAMLDLQIRHARLWFAGESGDWVLAAFQVHGLQDGLDNIVETYPEHAALQPGQLASILPAMMGSTMKNLRTAVDQKNKIEFERAYDSVSTACSGCHMAAGFTFLQVHRPTTPLLDNLSGTMTAATSVSK